jgi:hypothetical protein
MNALTKSNYVKSIREAFETSMMNLQGACELYVQAIDEDWRNKEFIQKELEHVIPKTAWVGMEQAGRGQIDCRLTFSRGGVHSNKIKKLQLSDQKRIMDGGLVDMVASDGSSIQVDARRVTKEQAEQVFDGATIRSADEQVAYLDSVEAEWKKVEKAVALTEVYKIEGGKLIIPCGCVLTKKEVMRIAMEMNQ